MSPLLVPPLEILMPPFNVTLVVAYKNQRWHKKQWGAGGEESTLGWGRGQNLVIRSLNIFTLLPFQHREFAFGTKTQLLKIKFHRKKVETLNSVGLQLSEMEYIPIYKKVR